MARKVYVQQSLLSILRAYTGIKATIIPPIVPQREGALIGNQYGNLRLALKLKIVSKEFN